MHLLLRYRLSSLCLIDAPPAVHIAIYPLCDASHGPA